MPKHSLVSASFNTVSVRQVQIAFSAVLTPRAIFRKKHRYKQGGYSFAKVASDLEKLERPHVESRTTVHPYVLRFILVLGWGQDGGNPHAIDRRISEVAHLCFAKRSARTPALGPVPNPKMRSNGTRIPGTTRGRAQTRDVKKDTNKTQEHGSNTHRRHRARCILRRLQEALGTPEKGEEVAQDQGARCLQWASLPASRSLGETGGQSWSRDMTKLQQEQKKANGTTPSYST